MCAPACGRPPWSSRSTIVAGRAASSGRTSGWGFKEVWTNHRLECVAIWRPDTEAAVACQSVEESGVFPGLTRADLDRLFVRGSPSAQAEFSRAVALCVADRLEAAGPC